VSHPLRTRAWYGGQNRDGFVHRSWMKRGLPDDAFDGKPMIGICNSASDLAPCNLHLTEVAEYVKRGVWEAGGVPLEFPVMSLGETQIRPTAMLYRNLMSMAVEESIRGNPIDGVVLLCGCDKTTPAMLMGAASVDLPAVVVSGGPMLTGRYEGRPIGSGTAVWRLNEEVRAGTRSLADFLAAESCMTRSKGSCNTMGTASTMASMVEALGMALPENAALPAADTRRLRLAHLTGRRIVGMVNEGLCPADVLTRSSFENAIRVLAAIGGSTNAVIHLLAIAGRIGVSLTLDDFDRLGADVPLLVDLLPSGRHLMEDFAAAGGIPAVLKEIAPLLDGDAPTVTGRPLRSYWEESRCFDREVIRPFDAPLKPAAGIAVLRGNLCPDGAVVKPSAASPELLTHTGPAVVFESIEDFNERIDDPNLDVEADSVLVLKGCGPKGYPGMPEVGNMRLPPRLLAQGITDMVRISDARMSGTAYGTVVLHVAPEAAAGGPLGLVHTGDLVTLDVPSRRLTLHVDDDELAQRRAAGPATRPVSAARGWYQLYVEHVTQADTGADLDFLVGASGSEITRESH
jgi:dihydroxy-acid dehydratase